MNNSLSDQDMMLKQMHAEKERMHQLTEDSQEYQHGYKNGLTVTKSKYLGKLRIQQSQINDKFIEAGETAADVMVLMELRGMLRLIKSLINEVETTL